jgi:hypothetical protein
LMKLPRRSVIERGCHLRCLRLPFLRPLEGERNSSSMSLRQSTSSRIVYSPRRQTGSRILLSIGDFGDASAGIDRTGRTRTNASIFSGMHRWIH